MTVSNQQLFSHAYLKGLLADSRNDEAASTLMSQIAEWAVSWDFSTPAAALRTAVMPSLDALGFAYATDAEDSRCLLLYADPTRNSLLGTAYVAPPGADLDETRKGTHWMFLAVRAARQHERRWALLTDGQRWRLLDAQDVAPYEVYLQLSLSGLVGGGRRADERTARAVYAFFRQPVWLQNGEGHCRLGEHHAASVKATERAEQHLKRHIEAVLGNICRGFIDGDGRSSYTEADRAAIYDAATIVMYRILFALYAEARGLLPAEDPVYAAHGMRSLIDRAMAYEEALLKPEGTTLWDGLRALWGWIDRGNADLGVPAYNGGLFDDRRNGDLGRDMRVLREGSIADAHLSAALVNLASIPTNGGREAIDYRDLSVRHLGSLYEGVLEYKLFIAEEPMLVRRTSSGELYLRASAVTQKKTDQFLPAKSVYFAQSPGERKATGSYYTPEDVVDYIVRHTVLQGLEERLRRFWEHCEESAPGTDQVDTALLDFVEREVLAFRVCDPAMGSGHFLVNATQAMTGFIVEALHTGGWANPSLDTSPAHWRRRVVGSCIYGVDINPLAVELAKLSLWLVTVEGGRALSFLDHHLRCGNSLVGARLDELQGASVGPRRRVGKPKAAPDGQLTLLDLPGFQEGMRGAVGDSLRLETSPESTAGEVHAKAEVYRALRKKLMQRYELIANLAVARRLGLRLDEATYHRLVQGYFSSEHASIVPSFARGVVQEASRLAEEHRFFHWQLEFPQVFFDGAGHARKHGGGFDAVIGNPPYVGQARTVFERVRYRTSKCGNLYAWFVECALDIASTAGKVGLIVPLSLVFSKQMTSLRRLLLDQPGKLSVASFDNIPDCIFNTGKESENTNRANSQRTSLFILHKDSSSHSIWTTSLLRWLTRERAQVFSSLRFADSTPLCSEEGFAMIGDQRLVAFGQRLRESGLTIGDLLSDGRESQFRLYVPTTSRYFIAASPEDLGRSSQLVLPFDSEESSQYALLLISSNVFYWHWRVFGDGFHVTGQNVLGFPLPMEKPDAREVQAMASRLVAAIPDCRVEKLNAGKAIPNVNFNKRMDILLDIDDWILKLLDYSGKLPRDIFAQSKSSTFLQPVAPSTEDDGECGGR